MEAQVTERLATTRRSVTSNPDSANAWGAYGADLHAHDLLDDAAACYRRARALEPGEFRWTYLLAVAETERGAGFERIVGLLDDALRLRPDYAPALIRRGRAMLSHGRLDDARTTFQRALDLDEASAAAHRGLGQTLIASGDAAAATIHLSRASELAPGDAATLSALSRALTLIGQTAQADRIADRARRAKPLTLLADSELAAVEARGVSSRHLFKRAQARLTRGELVEAREDLERVKALRPGDPDVSYLLGVASEGLGQEGRAIEQMRQVLDEKPDHTRARLSLARLLRAGGREDDALAELRTARKHAPADPLVLAALAGALARRELLDELIGVYEDLRAISPDEPRISMNLGTAWLKKGNLNRAESHLRNALSLDPGYADAHHRLGIVLQRLDRPDDARRHLEAAVRIDPDHPARQLLPQ